MKKIIIYSAICSLVVMGGCKDSFLDQDPPLYLLDEEIYTNPDRVESTLLGLYGNLKNTSGKSFIGGKTYLAFDNRGDDFANISNNNVTLFQTYNMIVGNEVAENEDSWAEAYQTINKANTFLAGIAANPDVIAETYDQYQAEAKFVRALSYYYLVNLYSMPYSIDPNAKAVPLRLLPEYNQEHNDLARSTVSEIYNHILSDISDISALPTGNNTYTTVTRATQAAARMLRMRVYMAMNDWQSAVNEGKEIEGFDYELMADPAAPFSTPFFTPENIFSLPMATNNRPNTQQSVAEYYHNGQIMVLDDTHGITSKPNYSLENDKRLEAFKGNNRMYLKFRDARDKLEWVPVFRYAETYLNLAECYVNLGNSEEAKKYLKLVRNRSIDPATDPLNIDNLSDTELREAVYNERRIELLAEGIRAIDIVRRGETFSKAGTLTVTPTDNGYIWPIPLKELTLNGAIND